MNRINKQQLYTFLFCLGLLISCVRILFIPHQQIPLLGEISEGGGKKKLGPCGIEWSFIELVFQLAWATQTFEPLWQIECPEERIIVLVLCVIC